MEKKRLVMGMAVSGVPALIALIVLVMVNAGWAREVHRITNLTIIEADKDEIKAVCGDYSACERKEGFTVEGRPVYTIWMPYVKDKDDSVHILMAGHEVLHVIRGKWHE